MHGWNQEGRSVESSFNALGSYLQTEVLGWLSVDDICTAISISCSVRALIGNHIVRILARGNRFQPQQTDLPPFVVSTVASMIRKRQRIKHQPTFTIFFNRFVRKRQTDLVQICLGLPFNAARFVRLVQLIPMGSVEIVDAWISDPDSNPGEFRNEALLLAILFGADAIMDRLLRSDEVDAAARCNQPIQMAIQQGRIEIVRQLLQHPRVMRDAIRSMQALLMTAMLNAKKDIHRLLKVLLRVYQVVNPANARLNKPRQ